MGSSEGAKTSCLDKGRHSEVTTRIENENGEQPQELSSVHLCGNINASRNYKKTAAFGSVQSCWTPHSGSPNFPLSNLQPSYSNSLLGIQNRLNCQHLTSSSSVCNTGLVLVSTTLSSVSVSETEISTTSECLSMLSDWEDVALIPDSQHSPSAEVLQLNEDPGDMRPETFGDADRGSESSMKDVGKTSLNMELSNKTVLFKRPTITVYNKATAPNKSTNPLAFKLPAAKAVTSSAGTLKENHVGLSSGTHKRKPSSPKSLPPAKKPPFIVYKDKEKPSKSSLSFRSFGLHHGSSGALNSSVNVNRLAENQRVTPPLCQCGRRARRLNVSNGGPNHGRVFYSCPVGKQEGHRKGCGYFKWEAALLKEKHALPSPPSAVRLQSWHTSVGSSKCGQQSLGLRPSMRT